MKQILIIFLLIGLFLSFSTKEETIATIECTTNTDLVIYFLCEERNTIIELFGVLPLTLPLI